MKFPCNIIWKIILGICFVLLSSFSFASSIEGITIYQRNMHLSEERKQNLADEIDRYRNADNIWDTLRQEFILPHYEDNPLVQEQIEWFLNHQDFLMRSATRAAPYLYYILQQARKRHLPAEVVLLPMIESAYNPFAYSTAGAAGIWQMMPKTASGYGIKQNWWYDGRRDVVASTKAAQDYLSYLASFFDANWLLAIAAYDTGEGNVLSAIRKNYQQGLSTEFWSLPLAQETREYVPRLLALATIISRPEEYPIEFPPVRNAPYLAQVDIGAQIDLKQAAVLAGLSLKELIQLNPGHNHSTTDPNGPFKLILPIENVQQFTENLEHSPLYPRVKWSRYRIREGDTVRSIAKQFNTSPNVIRNANPTMSASLKPGKRLLIPHHAPDLSKTLLEQKSVEVSSNERVFTPQSKMSYKDSLPNITTQQPYTLQPGDTLYMVRSHDDLTKIAKHFHTTSRTLLLANNLKSYDVRPGQKLIIPTHSISQDSNYQLTPGDTIYMVRKGDTMEKVAKKFHLSPANIRLTNLLASNTIQEGDRLVIPTHS